MADLETFDAPRESLIDGEVGSVAAGPRFSVAAATAQGVVLIEPGVAVPTPLGAVEVDVVGAGSTPDGDLMVATPADLLVWADSALSSLGIGPKLTGELVDVQAHGSDLWMRTASGLYLLRAGVVQEVRLDGLPLSGPFAPGGMLGGEPVVWASSDLTVVALAADDLSVQLSLDLSPPTSMAADATGELWAVTDEFLTRVDTAGEPSEIHLDSEVRAVYAHPEATGVWITTLDKALLAVDGELAIAASERIYDGSVDQLGRLLVPGPYALDRLTGENATGLLGLEDGAALEDDVTLTVVPTTPDQVSAAVIDVDGSEIEVDLATMTATVRAAEWLGEELHTAAARVTWSDGSSASSSPVQFTVASVGAVTWDDVIEPLYRDRCSVCHDGGTDTILDSSELWQQHIEAILDMVESGAMPIGGPALTAAESSLITTWRDGGFP